MKNISYIISNASVIFCRSIFIVIICLYSCTEETPVIKDNVVIENIYNVELDTPGTLFEMFDEKLSNSITSLIISGYMNESDIVFLRDMLGYGDESCDNNLHTVDLSDVAILSDSIGLIIEDNTLFDNAFEGCINLRSIILPDSLKKIGNRVFYNCVNLKCIKISDSVGFIGDEAFCCCSSLDSINLPKQISYLGNGIFSNCSSLKKVVLPYNLQRIPTRSFDNCTQLNGMIIPETVKSIGLNAFRNCSSYMTLVDLPENVIEIMDEAFWGAGIVNLKLPKKCKQIGNFVFSNCQNLERIEINECLETVGDGLVYKSANMKEFVGNSVKIATHKGVLYLKDDIKILSCPNGITGILEFEVDIKEIGTYSFAGCNKLKQIEFVTSPVKIGKSAFMGCSSLERIINLKGSITIDSYAFYDCEKLCDETFDFTSYGFSYLADFSFANCSSLRNLDLSNSTFEKVGDGAFLGCSSLRTIKLPLTVRTIGVSAFEGCISLESFVCNDNISEIQNKAFKNCKSFSEFIIPKELSSFNESAFDGCENLKAFGISNGNSYFQIYNGALYSKDGLVLKRVPIGLSGEYRILDSTQIIDDRALNGCAKIESIVLSNSVKNIGKEAFCKCLSLKSLVLPTTLNEIGDGCFRGCENLNSIIIPNGILDVRPNTFSECKSLKSIILPESTISLQTESFSGCISLSEIKIESLTPPYIGPNAFENVDKYRCTLSVPMGCLLKYSNAREWGGFPHIQEF